MATIALGVQLFVAGVTAAVAALTIRDRRAPGARWFGVMMVAVSVWALVSAAQQHPLFYGDVVYSFLVRIIWLPNFVIAVGWLCFALDYTGRDEYTTRRFVATLFVVPALAVFVVLCHPILVAELAESLGPAGEWVTALEAMDAAYPIAQAVGGAYIYSLIAIGSVLLLEVVAERPFPHPGQVLIGLVVLPPLALSVLQHGLLHWETFDPTAIGFLVSGIAGLVAVGRFRLFDVPLARARIVESFDSGVVVCGGAGEVYDYNGRARSVLGLSDAVLGSDIRTVLAESPLDFDSDPSVVAPSTDGQVEGEAVHSLAARLDGRTVAVAGSKGPEYVELQVSALEDVVGDPMSHVLLLYDVTDREQRKRELERKNEFLDEFTRVVSHDVATPLSVIENKARLVEVTGDADHTDDIYDATERVQGLVDELRDLAREGVQVGETKSVALSEVAADAWGSVESEGARLAVEASGTVDADRGRLRQLFENLFQNALVHGSGSEPAAETPARRPDGSGLVVTVGSLSDGFYVEDDGPGISPDRRARVFEQGYSTTDNGRGLGLAIVDRIVQGHGWDVEVREGEAGGARFEVYTTARQK